MSAMPQIANDNSQTAAPRAGGGVRPRPRVLHLLNYFEPGGTERQAVELLKRLPEDRFEVFLAALQLKGPLYREIAWRFPEVPEFPLTSFYDANALRQLARLRALLRRERIDIVHAHDFYAGVLGVAAARLTGVKVIGCQRNLKLSDRPVHRWGQRFINRFSHRVLVNADAIRDRILAAGHPAPENIVVIKNGLRLPEEAPRTEEGAPGDALRRELGLPADALLVGVVANLRPVKGHRYLIEAAAEVLRAVPRAHFVLVGEGELRGEIEAQARALDIADHVHLLGYRTDANRLQQAFDLAVLCSLHEGLPNSVMESMAAGIPVVATSVGGAPELVVDGQTGYLVPPADSGALARGIANALGDRETSAALAARGQRFITDQFGMDRMVNAVGALYTQLIEDHPRFRPDSRRKDFPL